MSRELDKAVEWEAINPKYPYMPREEWQSRIKKLKKLMEDNNIDSTIILNSQNRLYFFGAAKQYKYEWPYMGIIPVKGPTTMISNNEEAELVFPCEGYVERNIGFRGDSNAPKPNAPDPIVMMSEVIKEMNLDGKTIGMEFGAFMWWEGFNINQWEQFKRLLPEVKFVDITSLLWELRTIKSDWEIEVMRKLYKVTGKGYFQLINSARQGVNEKDLLDEMINVWMKEGIIECVYDMTVCPILKLRDRILENGDIILLDGGPTYKGYHADVQRMIHIGDPGKEVQKIAEFAMRGAEAVEAVLRPGITAGEVFNAGISEVAKGDPDIWNKIRSQRFAGGWVGHGQGLNMHEYPYLEDGSDVVLKERMIVSVEIPSCMPNTPKDKLILANMPEDTYLITKNGCERLTLELGPRDIYIKT